MKHLLLACLTAALLALSQCTDQQTEDLRERRDVVEGEEEADNGWGAWVAVGKCSRTCGGGVYFEERSCYQTSPISGTVGGEEDHCLGPSKRYISCNTEACPPGSTDFRLVQCAKYNTHDFNGKRYEWVPYYEVGDESVCELTCQAVGETFYNRLAKWVIDGTRCRPDATDICIAGVCRPVGCDGTLGSEKEFDECRVCGGDGSSCHFKKGSVTTDELILGYNDILLIPAGATNIHIQEKTASKNYLAVRSVGGDFYFNKEWVIDPSGMYDIAGTKFKYIRGKFPEVDPEYLSANGPTTEAVYMTLLSQTLANSPEILYEFYIPNSLEEAEEVYRWEMGVWGSCSRHCNTGDRQRSIKCMDSRDSEVDMSLCDASTKPMDNETCNTEECQASWYVGFWEDCSVECGMGSQERTVFCQQEHEADIYVMVEDSLCQDNPRPPSTRSCDTGVTCPYAQPHEETEVSKSEDPVPDASPETSPESQPEDMSVSPSESVSEPQVSPSEENNSEADTSPEDMSELVSELEVSTSEDEDTTSEIGLTSEWDVSDLFPVTMTQPEKMSASVEIVTMAWEIGDWSACNQVCGPGTQIRMVRCTQMGACDPEKKPKESRECNEMPCEGVEWVTSDWEGCPDSCDGGAETRTAVCSTQEGKIYPDDTCDLGRRPVVERPCPSSCVPKPKWHASEWGECSVRCGAGVQKRRVVCAVDNGDTLTVAMESECDAKAKMLQEQRCTAVDCSTATWFSAPFGKCSAECGGGQKKREVMCLSDGAPVNMRHCDTNQRPAVYEDCNNQPCDDDNLLIVGGCKGTQYGCCPDGLVAAEGPNYFGCPASDPIPRGACVEMDFGCCLDGITPAQGPFLYGCPKYTCKDTLYGCCADGQTAAKGIDGEGCPEHIYGCDKYGFGCCPDGVTSAQGPDHEGCPSKTPLAVRVSCHQSQFGCCADGVTAAAGIDGLGCPEARQDKGEDLESSGEPCDGGDCNVISTGCASSLYGCCQDGSTHAKGPNSFGCPGIAARIVGCASMAYGCCPDGRTAALGANNEGCDAGSGEGEAECQSSAYGCCPDGSTAAQGPSYDGCDTDCDAMVYGCCPDGVQTAEGPNFLGCAVESSYVSTCADSTYGCCPNGKSAALGPNNAGCPSVIAKRAECGLPNERGPCSNYTVRWAFDASYGQCSRFWYGGCEGNGNNFETKEECHKGCVHPDVEIETCYLPKSVGRCRASVTRYYYNPETRRCEEFHYGGCLGNDNRYETLEVCERQCVAPHTPDVCNQPSLTGPCRGNFHRWFYDHSEGICKQFIYGGCQGNNNRFNSKQDCEQRCLSPATTVCLQPKDSGPCQAYFKRWYFDASASKCAEFVYGGCGGNNNLFSSKHECQKTCRELLKEKTVDICHLPKETGPCTAYFERWYYDKSDGYCKMFVYGGCQGNKNRFIAEQECRKQCRANPPVDVCMLPKAIGSCHSAIQRYFFNEATATCEGFLYSGCGGNANSFDTLEECKKSCDKHMRKFEVSKGKEHCYQPMAPGPCLNSLSRYHYNSVSGRCEEFQYGGCGGNRNRFISAQLCEAECMNETTTTAVAPTTPDVTCTLNYDSGDCFAYIPMFYFDTEKAECVKFIYGGCGGNPNRFKTRLACEQRCQPNKPHSIVSGLAKCALSKETGVCDGPAVSVTKWFYNMEAGQCEKFIYSLCGGNANRFTSKRECEEACPVADICHQEAVTGPCRASKQRFHFDPATGQCNQFTYGGCPGNANRFLKQESCEAACSQFAVITTSEPVTATELETCSKPREAGQCHTYSLRWYHDNHQEKCTQFVYSGCGGNDNNFKTEAECEQRCSRDSVGKTDDTTTVAATVAPEADKETCSKPREVGKCYTHTLRWYHDNQQEKCIEFVYSGCGGNDNNFKTEAECKQRCSRDSVGKTDDTTTVAATMAPEADKDVCALSNNTGPCKGAFDSWFYNSAVGECRQFVYGGCEGNGNRFETKDACEQRCRQPAPVESAEDRGDEFDICELKQDMGTCYKYTIKWFYDASISRCRRFYYGSCGGNGNRFETREECVQMCVERKVKPVVEVAEKDKGVCDFAVEVGLCDESLPRWHFDKSSGKCTEFYYSGCKGNGNNFVTQEACESLCGRDNTGKTEYQKNKAMGTCRLPKVVGPCFDEVLRFYFDDETGLCRPFLYGGCQGNKNNFKTQEECYAICTRYPDKYETTKPADCFETSDTGSCDANEARWFFDANKGDCVAFYYSGCNGNGNNFRSYDDCIAFCSKVSHTCGVLTCDLSCPHGFARGDDGCQECKCLDPCEKLECPHDQMCVTETAPCSAQPCPSPKAICKATGPSACPTLDPQQAEVTESTCSSDTDCPDDATCCFNGNTYICVAQPEVAGCVHTLFGCCPDGSTEAKGWNFIGCPAEAPVILTEKTQYLVAEGGVIVIPCKSRAAPVAQVTWYKDRKPLKLSEKLNGFRRLTDGSLEISHVSQSEHGVYTCRAFNSIGAATKTYTLIVHVMPKFADTPRQVVVTAGNKAVLQCSASGSPKPKISWLRNNQLVAIDTVHIMQMQNGTLVIEDVQESDAGNYSCEANNGMEDPPRRLVSLSVLGRMHVTLDKANVMTDRGEELKLICRTRSEPDISLEWSKDGDQIDADNSRIEIMENELNIKELRVADSGEYTCTASRGLDSVSATAIVKVKGMDLPEGCTDKPMFANCKLIIEGDFCTHPYFRVFCCKSCHEAGKLP